MNNSIEKQMHSLADTVGQYHRALELAEIALVAAYGEPGPKPTPTDNKSGRQAILTVRQVLGRR